MRNDHMVLSAFGQASASKTQNGAWSHPASTPDVTDPEYYINLARELEHAGFDMVFFDDRLAMPAVYGGNFRKAVELGTRAIKLDLLTILGLMAAHTTRLGLGATYSTTYYHPYHVARAFATLDHLTRGRAIWNIVTSLNEDEAANFGTEHLDHDGRYDRADEFLEAATALWNSWDADAYELDRASGRFADPDKVREAAFDGDTFATRGPLTVPRPPQGWPTLLQAGQSSRGRTFAGRWADLIFISASTLERARKSYREQREAVEAAGRDTSAVKIMPSVYTLVAETDEIARERKKFLESRSDPVEALMLLSELSGVDLSKLDATRPIPDDLLDRTTGSKAIMTNVIGRLRELYGPDATPRDLADFSVKGTSQWFVGDAMTVADGLEEWFLEEGCDGFVINQAETPGSWESFGRSVIPELRRRGRVAPAGENGLNFRARVGLEREPSKR
ncbi:NtaA/DmoA family FMN-dependent monooxygenase [Microbacterium album]|uniref:Monooxygenase n=1 Tax=Microbacterium album TaxID=2053191 RepID=A0A917IDS0_9MICO|nr:NtaA/DmoA family FMN-dependent monooxygenase [Microbacterium album]GGH42584.1 monooxygenase [Microbacterium album]